MVKHFARKEDLILLNNTGFRNSYATPTTWNGLSTAYPIHAAIVGKEDVLARIDGQTVVPDWLWQVRLRTTNMGAD